MKASPATGSRFADPTSIVTVVALSALPFLFLLPLFGAPFERDQGTYATIARGWTEGAIPYRDLWDNKGPLLFLWYVVSFLGMGQTTAAPQVMAGLVAGLCVPFVWATAGVLFDRRTALLSAAAFALSFANVYLQVTANGEVFMLLPLTAGLWAFAVGTTGGRLRWFVLAGILTTLAVLTRQSAVWTFIGYGAWLAAVWWRHPAERARLSRAAAALVAGVVLGAAPCILYFAANGAAADLWYATFGYNLSWAATQSFWLKLVPPLLSDPLSLLGGAFFWALALVGIWRLWRRGDRRAWLVLAILVVSEAAAQTTGKGTAHYAIQLLPTAAIAAGVAVPAVAAHWQRRPVAIALAACLAVTLGLAALAYLQPTATDRFRVQYTFGDYADDAIDGSAVATAVARLTDPGDCVYEWGRSSQVFFLARRTPCSRWLHDRSSEVDPTVIDEVLADLEARAPAAIVVTTDRPLPSGLRDLIDARYALVERVAYASIYTPRGDL